MLIILSGSDSQNNETTSPGVSSKNYVVARPGIIIHPHLPADTSAHHKQPDEIKYTHQMSPPSYTSGMFYFQFQIDPQQ